MKIFTYTLVTCFVTAALADDAVDSLIAWAGSTNDERERRALLEKRAAHSSRESLGALRVHYPGFTSEVRSTDRVLRIELVP